MEKDWKKILITRDKFEADLIRGLLEDAGIAAVILNKRDSSITAFGEIELYVHEDNEEAAKQILKEKDLE